MEMHVLPVGHLASRDTIDISDIAGERYVQRSYCEFNDVVDSVLMRRRLRNRLSQRS